MFKFKMTNFEITIPTDIKKLKKQIETLTERINIIENQVEIYKVQIKAPKRRVKKIREKKTSIEKVLIIHEQALKCTQKNYHERLDI